MKKYILHISQNYSFEILRPLQTEIANRGGDSIWFVGSSAVDISKFSEGERFTSNPRELRNYNSCAVFSPGNNVPGFLKGVKVQVFHGLEWKKKGHFRIRDYFDLYCTQGPITTHKFNELAKRHQNFLVRETGWSKLDLLFSATPYPLESSKPVVLYAPTFSEKLTSALDCVEQIESLIKKNKQFWLIKFHPLMNASTIKKYSDLSYPNLKIIDDYSILGLLNRADILISDTSSVIGEFMLLGKPVVTYKNLAPEESLINVTEPEALSGALQRALNDSDQLKERMGYSNSQLHPYSDGRSSARILDAVNEMLAGVRPIKNRPLNLFRNMKLRWRFRYWLLGR